VPADDLVTAVLARRLGRTVANVAQSFYGPQQELELLRRYGLPLGPTACVWVFYEGNDLTDMRRYDRARRAWPTLSRKWRSFPQRSFARNVVLALTRRLRARGYHGVYADQISGLFRIRSGERVRLEFWNDRQLAPADRKSLADLPAVLARAQAMCRAQGASFLLVFAPSMFRTYGRFTEFAPDALPRRWRATEEVPRRLESLIREDLAGARFVDLTPDLLEHAARGELLYQPDNAHWSAQGHRVAAERIAEALRDEEQGVSR
jgi:hypothetical protein